MERIEGGWALVLGPGGPVDSGLPGGFRQAAEAAERIRSAVPVPGGC